MRVRVLFAGVVLTVLWLSSCDVMAQFDLSLEPAPEEEKNKGPFVVYEDEIEFGFGYNTSSSYKFREYNGLPAKGPFIIGDVLVRGRAPEDAEAPYYFDIVGTNLGLSSRYMRGDFGKQGNYSLFLEYDQTPHLQFDDGATPYEGIGGSDLTLPAGWVTSTSTAGLTQLLPSLEIFDVETERKEIGTGFNYTIDRKWNVGLSFSHEDKDGTETIGSLFLTNGADLPQPIDYKTDQVNFDVGYAGEKGQFRLGYEFSYFDNGEESLQFQNAFVQAFFAPGAGYPTGVGAFALPPDNLAHNLVLSGGYNFPARTRVTVNASFSHYEQNETFLPYTANTLLTVNTPLPRSSAQAEVNNYLFNLGVSSRPWAKWDLRGDYRYFNRDNNTPQDVFVYVNTDSLNQPVGIDNANARINLPYSLEQHELKLDAGYRILPRSKLSVGYEFDRIDRDYQEVDYTTEHTLSAKFQSNPMSNVNGWVQFAHTIRDNSGYQGNVPFLEGHTPEYLATLPPDEQFQNDPGLRKYNLADLTQNAVRGVISYTPTPALGLTVDANYTNGDFTDSPVGLQNRSEASGTLDVSYMPNEGLNTHGFITYENRQYDQLGCSFNPNAPQAVNYACILTPPAPQRQWTADGNDNVFTVGVGAEWKINEKWNLGMDYLYTKATTDIDVTGGVELQPLFNLPRLDSLRHRLGLRLDYQFREKVRLRMSYLYEHLDTDDFALDGVAPDSVAQLITLGNQSPDYDAHVFGVAFVYQWD